MSKKLEGNGLWESSRMMLPQHKEQSMSVQNNTPSLKREPPTKKELELMRDCILLPVALHIVEKNRRTIEMSSQTLKTVYAAAAKILAGHIRGDVQKFKKMLVEQNIRLYEHSKEESQLVYRYVCRGHEDTVVMTKDFIRAEVSVRIGRYARSLVTAIEKTSAEALRR
ncbi:hypothetical protein [Paenibacillus rigui]|uniref:Uncharacterized protein n=1 Tax=Paenibacillus rigui TaxID=554312 RepID=A0A229UR17_9BACL|nr:hypothetical protein [Paenibacillus rigui]OXM85840.1 hypothetical protein CF651_11425 [Paenibacillus rigui]